MKRFDVSGLGKLLTLGAVLTGVSAPAVSDDYILIMKDPAGSPPNVQVGTGTFTVTNYPNQDPAGDPVSIEVSFDASTGLPDYAGMARVFATDTWITDGLCTDFNKEGECIAWTTSDCPDPSIPGCDKSVNEGGGPSRVFQIVNFRPGVPEDGTGGSSLLLVGSGDNDGTGDWRVNNPPAGADPIVGTYFIRNTVPEPSLVLLFLTGVVPLAVVRSRRKAIGGSKAA